MNEKRVILAGGSGFIGEALAKELQGRGYHIVILSRTPRARTDGVTELAWDGENIGPWMKALDGAEAVVNLAGRNINCEHTPENLAAIKSSRVNSVRALAAALPHLGQMPRVWVQASAVGFYGDTGDRVCDETSAAGSGPLATVCREWEAAYQAIPAPRPRMVALRIGFVLGREGGALPVLSKLTRRFLGGTAGNGRQYISWIHVADLTQMFAAAITDDLSGIYNSVAPTPVTNKLFMQSLRRACHRPWSPPAPALLVRFGCKLMHSAATLALMSTRCVPKRLIERDFRFKFNDVDAALQDLCR